MYWCILKQNLVGLIFMMFYYTLKIELLLAYVRDEGGKGCYMIPVLHPILPNELQSKSFIFAACLCMCNSQRLQYIKIALHTVRLPVLN